MASKFSSARPYGSKLAWHEAQIAFLRCASRRTRTFWSEASAEVGSASSFGTFGGGSLGGVHKRFSRIQRPRSVGAVRYSYELRAKKAPMPRKPKRFGAFVIRWVPDAGGETPYSVARSEFT